MVVFVEQVETDGFAARGAKKPLAGYPTTTGGDGMHVYIPVEPIYTYEETRTFARLTEHREQQPGEDAGDGDHDEQLDEREAASMGHGASG